MVEPLSRRELLAGALAAGAAAAMRPLSAMAAKTPPAPQAFRFVHLTDIHVQTELSAARGFAKALRAVESLKPRPDFILTGGDLVFDASAVPSERANSLFRLYKQVLADNTSRPVFNTVGNHDVFGWDGRKGITPTSPGYGKQMVRDYLGLKQTYYRFDHRGWRFFVLDNIQPANTQRGYQGFLDPPQLAWLADELKHTNPRTPVVFCEHIPIMTVTPFAFEQSYHEPQWRLDNSLVCGDTPKRLDLFQGRNVRLCLSGHIHQCDRVEFRGVRFVCDGAVCANWWKGPREGMNEGFGVFDLHADGGIDYQYFEYGWQARG